MAAETIPVRIIGGPSPAPAQESPPPPGLPAEGAAPSRIITGPTALPQPRPASPPGPGGTASTASGRRVVSPDPAAPATAGQARAPGPARIITGPVAPPIGRPAGPEPFQLPQRVVFGTLPRGGAVLLDRLFRGIAERLGLRYSSGDSQRDGKRDWDIARLPDCRIGDLDGEAVRGVVALRDPRDVVVSATRHHLRGDEAWLHEPRRGLGGRTYQETLRAMPSDEARYLFEMDGTSGRLIRRMAEWAAPPPGFITTRLELLATDSDFTEFERIFAFLGLTGAGLDAARKQARQVSLFSRVVALAERAARLAETDRVGIAARLGPGAIGQRRADWQGRPVDPESVRIAGGGRPGEWQKAFTPAVLQAFVERFGDLTERLGYPPSSPAPAVLPAHAAPAA